MRTVVFAAVYERFKGKWASRFPAVVVVNSGTKTKWVGDAQHWSDFGGKDVLPST